MRTYPTKDQLTVVFYLLARDHLPAGELVKCVEMSRGHDEYQLSNPHLAAFAAELASRLRSHANDSPSVLELEEWPPTV